MKCGLQAKFGEHDAQVRAAFEVIERLIDPPVPKWRRIGFHRKEH